MSLINSIFSFLTLNDEYDDENEMDDFVNDFEEPEEPRVSRREERRQKKEEKAEVRTSRFRKVQEAEEEETPVRTERPLRSVRQPSKIVPIHTMQNGMEVTVVKPTSFEDSQDICDYLLTGRIVVVNLEEYDRDESQRVMDFLFGCIYAINGKLHQISRYIFIFSPDTIDISGDYLNSIIPSVEFGVPTINKEY